MFCFVANNYRYVFYSVDMLITQNFSENESHNDTTVLIILAKIGDTLTIGRIL